MGAIGGRERASLVFILVDNNIAKSKHKLFFTH